MISQTNAAAVRSAYANTLNQPKGAKTNTATTVSKQGDLSKIDQIKESIASGDYAIDLEALSKKIAQELL